MIINTIKTVAIALLGMCAAGTAVAQDAAPEHTGPSFSWSVTGATDYVWRGASQTGGDPSVFIAGSMSWGDFYAGAGAEHVDFGNEIDIEYDFWAGWAKDLGAFTLDVGLVRYGYMNAPDGVDIDTLEFKVGASKSFGAANAGVTVYWTDDYFGNGDSATYVELNGGYAISDQWSVSAAVGQQEINAADDSYVNWNVGVSYAPADNVTLDVRYHDTDVHEWGSAFDSGLLASIGVAM